MARERIHLKTGEVVETDVNGRSLDGETGHALLIPAGDYPSFADYILAAQSGREITVKRAQGGEHDGRWEEQ